jgi:cell division protein ZapA
MDPNAPQKQTTRVTILNQTYSIVTDGDPALTLALAQDVDDLMTSIARQAGNLDATRTAVLTCLHLADQLRIARQQIIELRQTIGARTGALNHLLEQVEVAAHDQRALFERPRK